MRDSVLAVDEAVTNAGVSAGISKARVGFFARDARSAFGGIARTGDRDVPCHCGACVEVCCDGESIGYERGWMCGMNALDGRVRNGAVWLGIDRAEGLARLGISAALGRELRRPLRPSQIHW